MSSTSLSSSSSPSSLDNDAQKRLRTCKNVSLEFKDNIPLGSKFVRTRHKSMRCFPTCSPIHKTSSFCGGPLYVTVKNESEEEESEKSVSTARLIGEFRNKSKTPSLKLGDVYIENTISTIIPARLYKSEGKTLQFIFMPPGKWTFLEKIKPNDIHVFTVYYIEGEQVCATLDSNPFQVIPIWKVPSQQNLKEEQDEVEERDKEDSMEEEQQSNEGSPKSQNPQPALKDEFQRWKTLAPSQFPSIAIASRGPLPSELLFGQTPSTMYSHNLYPPNLHLAFRPPNFPFFGFPPPNNPPS